MANTKQRPPRKDETGSVLPLGVATPSGNEKTPPCSGKGPALSHHPRTERAEIWVSAPVKGLHLIVFKGIYIQQRGMALANRVADIVPTWAFRVYVSNSSSIPVRLVKGMNIGTLRQRTTKPLSPNKTEEELLLVVDEGSSLEECEGIRGSSLFPEAMDEQKDSETEAEFSRLGRSE